MPLKPGRPARSGPPHLRLGINIDHVATIRNARGGRHPDPLRAAHLAISGGADGITAHLREDRRHISDSDIARLKQELTCPLNLEMAATDEMLAIALRHLPHACCLVPEKREERTTEGGLDAAGQHNHLAYYVDKLNGAGIRVSLFIEPSEEQVTAAVRLGAPVVEFHTGRYAHVEGEERATGCQGVAEEDLEHVFLVSIVAGVLFPDERVRGHRVKLVIILFSKRSKFEEFALQTGLEVKWHSSDPQECRSMCPRHLPG